MKPRKHNLYCRDGECGPERLQLFCGMIVVGALQICSINLNQEVAGRCYTLRCITVAGAYMLEYTNWPCTPDRALCKSRAATGTAFKQEELWKRTCVGLARASARFSNLQYPGVSPTLLEGLPGRSSDLMRSLGRVAVK